MAVLVEFTEQAAAIRFTGTDRFYAISRGIDLPYPRVLGARVMSRPAAIAACPRRRFPGMGWPGFLRAGCYGIGQRRQLWLVHRAGRLLAIYLRGEPYHRIVVEIALPEAVAHRINDAIAATPGTPRS